MHRLEHRLRMAAALGGMVMNAACVSSSIRSDTDRVRELSRMEHLADVPESEVDPVSSPEVGAMLSKPLTAKSAVKLALLNNRELRAKLRMMGVSRGRLKQAGLLPNPEAEIELLPEQDSDIELRLEYDITGALLAPMRSRAFEPALDAARYETAIAVVELGYMVRVQFYRVQAQEARLAIAQQMLDAYAAGREAAIALRKAGNVRELDLAQHEVAYEKARILVAELELGRMNAREALHRLLGLYGPETAWSVQGYLDPVPAGTVSVPEHIETQALKHSLELTQRRHELESLARRAGVKDTAGWLPDVAVDVHALKSDAESTPVRESWRFGAGVRFSVPIFDRSQGEVLELESKFSAQLERYYGLAVDVRSMARQARAELESAHARAAQYLRVIVPAQRRVTDQVMLQYNAMQVGVFDVLRASRERLQVELDSVDAQLAYWKAHAALRALLAGVAVAQPSEEVATSVSFSDERVEEH